MKITLNRATNIRKETQTDIHLNEKFGKDGEKIIATLNAIRRRLPKGHRDINRINQVTLDIRCHNFWSFRGGYILTRLGEYKMY